MSMEASAGYVSDLCRRRLLWYADSFKALSESYNKEQSVISEDRHDAISSKRVWENGQILKGQMKEMAQICEEMAHEMVMYRPLEDRRRRKLIKGLAEEKIRVYDPCILTKDDGRQVYVMVLSSDRKEGVPGTEAANLVSVLLGQNLEIADSSPILVDRIPRCFLMEPKPYYVAMTGFAKAVKEDETISGDQYGVIENEVGMLKVLLSDGTGSGQQAGEDSERVIAIFDKLVQAGYSTERAVQMVNEAMYTLGEDCRHPTLDLCELNLHEGVARFYKAGAAACFIKGRSTLEMIAPDSMPLGIFRQPYLQSEDRMLQDGDLIILMTDGVLEAFGENYEETVKGFLANIREQNPQALARVILQSAVFAGRGRVRDDMTVAVIGIWENA